MDSLPFPAPGLPLPLLSIAHSSSSGSSPPMATTSSSSEANPHVEGQLEEAKKDECGTSVPGMRNIAQLAAEEIEPYVRKRRHSGSSSERSRKRAEKLNEEDQNILRLCINSRERRRMHDLNDALDELRRVIPYTEGGQSNARKLSKINTIILATNWIRQLSNDLAQSRAQNEKLMVQLLAAKTTTTANGRKSEEQPGKEEEERGMALGQRAKNGTEEGEEDNGHEGKAQNAGVPSASSPAIGLSKCASPAAIEASTGQESAIELTASPTAGTIATVQLPTVFDQGGMSAEQRAVIASFLMNGPGRVPQMQPRPMATPLSPGIFPPNLLPLPSPLAISAPPQFVQQPKNGQMLPNVRPQGHKIGGKRRKAESCQNMPEMPPAGQCHAIAQLRPPSHFGSVQQMLAQPNGQTKDGNGILSAGPGLLMGLALSALFPANPNGASIFPSVPVPISKADSNEAGGKDEAREIAAQEGGGGFQLATK